MFDNDIHIKGKHATMAKALCQTSTKQQSKQTDVFDTIMDIYMAAVAIGLTKGLKAEPDNSDDNVNILAAKVIKEKLNLEYLLQLSILIDNSQNLTVEQKINRAFRQEELEQSKLIFSQYVCGGIEWLHEQFRGCHTDDDYYQQINTIVQDYN